jgi:amidase
VCFSSEQKENPVTRRELLRLAAMGAAGTMIDLPAARAGEPAAPSAGAEAVKLEEATVAQLRGAIEAGRATAVSLTRQYLARIAQLDKGGPGLNAVMELNPDALAIAQALDEERKAKGARGSLHGIPVLVKDNLDSHDRMMTTAGSLAMLGSIPARDSFVVQRLREAGAVLLGKTNLSEWANFRGSRSTSGWSARGGLTRNPYVLDRNPSGSSSGSAVAVSASLCAVAVRTETDGSIVSPSSLCGIVGVKPTVGLVSRAGIIPISKSQDTAGPMARTVTDAAILLGAMAGVDSRDEATEASRGKGHADYTQFLDADGLRGARIGVPRRFFRLGGKADAVVAEALEILKKHGAELVDPAEIPSLTKLGDAEYQVMLYEFKAGLNAYLATLGEGAPVRTLGEVIEFNRRNAEKELPYFGQETFLAAEAKGPLTDKGYLDAVERCRRLSRAEGIDAVMDEHKLDAFVAPTGGPAGKTDLVYGDRGVGGSSGPAAVSGYPSVRVPAGQVFGLPVGLSFFGRAYSEPVLLKLAFAFEQASGARRAPGFLGTVG